MERAGASVGYRRARRFSDYVPGPGLSLPTSQWVRWAVGFLLLCQIQALALIDRVLYGEWMGKPGDKFTQTINLLQIGIGVLLFVRGRRHWRGLRRGGSLSFALAAFVLMSVVWSINPAATMRSGVQYFFFLIAAIGVAENVEADDFMDLLAWVCFLAAIASLVLLAVAPASVIGEYAGDFRGVFPQKNPLGEAMAMGVLASLHGIRTGERNRFLRILIIATLSLTGLRSGSMTSMLTIALFVVLGSVLGSLVKHRRFSPATLIGFTALAAPLAFFAVLNQGALLELMGKDPTLTGRTDIWRYVTPSIFERPLLGWGYAAFWTTDNPAAWRIAETLRWWVPQAHNGVLEILLSVGSLGLVFYLMLLWRVLRLSVSCMQTEDRQLGITSFLLCAGVIVNGVSENVLLYTGSITCVFFIAGFYCERALSTKIRWRPLAVADDIFGREAWRDSRDSRVIAVDAPAS